MHHLWRQPANRSRSMRLLDILHKPAECWRVGMGFLQRKLGNGPKSRRIAEQQKAIADLQAELNRAQIAFQVAKAEIAMLKAELETEKKEHGKQKRATGQMWKFIHLRHRLAVPQAHNSIRSILTQAESR